VANLEDDELEGLGGLGQLLFGGLGGGKNSQGQTDNEFEQLQQLLVSPEVVELQDRMAKAEQKLGEVERQMFDPQDLVKLMLPLISKLLDRKLAKLKTEILETIEPMVDRIVEVQNEQHNALSIRVIGVQKNSDLPTSEEADG
jgi:hypothetical protein